MAEKPNPHPVCIFCSVSPCVNWCPAVLRGASIKPPRTPEVFQPAHIRAMCEERRRYLKTDSHAGGHGLASPIPDVVPHLGP